jgi:hypothetical protein
LPERQGRCVLKVRPPDHHDVAVSAGLLIKGVAKPVYRGNETALDCLNRCDVHGGGKRVIRGLTVIHIVVGVDWFL